jgi:hypothetical protein
MRMHVWAVLMMGLGLGTTGAKIQPQSTTQGQMEGMEMARTRAGARVTIWGDERPARWVRNLMAIQVLTAQ